MVITFLTITWFFLVNFENQSIPEDKRTISVKGIHWIHWNLLDVINGSIGYPLDLLKTCNYIQWILIDPLDPLDPFSGYRIDIQWIHWISNGSIEMDPLDPIAGCQVVQLIH